MRQLTSMELDDEDKVDALQPIPMDSKPDHPYGLRICLTGAECDKLEIGPTEFKVGGVIRFEANARVTHVSHGEGGVCRIELQIEDMDIESEDAEND